MNLESRAAIAAESVRDAETEAEHSAMSELEERQYEAKRRQDALLLTLEEIAEHLAVIGSEVGSQTGICCASFGGLGPEIILTTEAFYRAFPHGAEKVEEFPEQSLVCRSVTFFGVKVLCTQQARYVRACP